MFTTDPQSVKQVIDLATQRAESIAKEHLEVKTLLTHEDEQGKHYRYITPESNTEIVIPHLEPKRDHTLLTLASFIAFLNNPTHNQNGATVFVSSDMITADLAYQQAYGNTQDVSMALKYAEEFVALSTAFAPSAVKQKDIWRILATQCAGCFPDSLLLAVSNLNVKATRQNERKIDITGLTTGGNAYNVNITSDAGGGHAAGVTVPTEWEYEGRIYNCVPNLVKLKLRLELNESEGELLFTLHPIRLQTTLDTARDQIVQTLTEELNDNNHVFQGIQ